MAASLSHAAKVISGTAVARSIREQLKQEVIRVRGQGLPGFAPKLVIVQVGDRSDSNVYVNAKMKAAAEAEVNAQHLRLPKSISESELLQELKLLNDSPDVHGIIVQMPLDCSTNIDSHLVTNYVSDSKDVDGLNVINQGKVATGDLTTGFLPCTPAGCMDLIRSSGAEVRGANAVVLGRSKIVGTPMTELLKWNDATVTTCHSRTRDLKTVVGSADILVAAVGRAHFVPGDWIKPGAVVIDCGINTIQDPSRKSGHRLVGDVDYSAASQVASHITPVPGGVGPMTVALLISNVVKSAKRMANVKDD